MTRDFKDPKEKDREDLFSATHPFELMRFVPPCRATARKDGKARETMFLGIKKVHMAPLCKIDVHVELPAEAEVQEDECGKLTQRLYGCRLAAQAWEEHYTALLKADGFKRLKSAPVTFVHKGRDMIGVKHGDNFIWEGWDDDFDWALKVLEKEYELKNRGRLGPDPNDARKIHMLGRITEYTDDAVTWSGDPRHQMLLRIISGWTTPRMC